MYERHFGFHERPFSLLPDPSFLYMSERHRMALALLEYGLTNQAGFTAVTGGIGTGKTTLLRHLLNNMEQDVTVGLISNTHRSFGELLQWILLAFNLDHTGKSKVEMYQAFIDFVIGEYARNRRTVLIVDEAQNMAPAALEELRMLSNVNADKDQVLQVILVGQQQLRDTLRRPDLVQFAQRVAVDYHLTPLTEEETIHYVRHRVTVAGGREDLFDDAACKTVFRYSGGTPRLVNLLCDLALVYAYADQRDHIDASLMEDVAQEKMKGGLFPTADKMAAAGQQQQAMPETDGPVQGYAEPVLTQQVHPAADKKKRLRVAIAGTSAELCEHLGALLESDRLHVSARLPLDEFLVNRLDPARVDLLLVDLDEEGEKCMDGLYDVLSDWGLPVVFNDSQLTRSSLQGTNREFGQKLRAKLTSLGTSSDADSVHSSQDTAWTL